MDNLKFLTTYSANNTINFSGIASRLLNHMALYSGQQAYRLAEIEFYLYREGHKDPFAHRHPIQIEPGLWYIHRRGSGQHSYTGGTRKGIDITFGNGENIFGGILIRALQDLENESNYIYGPSLAVDRLMQDLELENEKVATLDERMGAHAVDDARSPVHLKTTKMAQLPIYTAPRYGLSLRNLEKRPDKAERLQYHPLPYRFFTLPQKTHKGKEAIARIWLEQKKYTAEEIRQIFGYRIV